MKSIKNTIAEALRLKQQLYEDLDFQRNVEVAADLCVEAFIRNGKVLLCGNGGSAADAQHIAAELSGRFKKDRPPLYAEALHVNTSFLTAVANDYGFEHAFARMTQAAGNENDILIAISTSGNSTNILNAAIAARSIPMKVIGFTGNSGGKLAALCDVLIDVPSDDTARIQEIHILVGHMLCEIIEEKIFA